MNPSSWFFGCKVDFIICILIICLFSVTVHDWVGSYELCAINLSSHQISDASSSLIINRWNFMFRRFQCACKIVERVPSQRVFFPTPAADSHDWRRFLHQTAFLHEGPEAFTIVFSGGGSFYYSHHIYRLQRVRCVVVALIYRTFIFGISP